MQLLVCRHVRSLARLLDVVFAKLAVVSFVIQNLFELLCHGEGATRGSLLQIPHHASTYVAGEILCVAL